MAGPSLWHLPYGRCGRRLNGSTIPRTVPMRLHNPALCRHMVLGPICRRVTAFQKALHTRQQAIHQRRSAVADESSFDFIVVGSGAGGGVLASRLARNDKGLSVVLIEAGGDPRDNKHYKVPAFHALATEDAELRWDYFVQHFSKPALAAQDGKHEPGKGIFYPRASAVGGCTAHHAMITVYPDPSDWDGIARSTGDDSWRHESMWRYFKRCTDDDGFGWLSIEAAGLSEVLQVAQDEKVREIVFAGLRHAPHLLRTIWRGVATTFSELLTPEHEPDAVLGDTNHDGQIGGDREGLYRIPLSIRGGERCGVTEFLYETRDHPTYGRNLTIWPGCLATRVLLDGDRRAIGVEYLPRARAYRADRDPPTDQRSWDAASGDLKTVMARQEVILAGGAFNTPQLLMLSGIGPRKELERLGIPLVAERPGVGENLQDRYEIPVIDELKEEFEALKGYSFDPDCDHPGLQRWTADRKGLYATNGGTIAIMRRSRRKRERDGENADCDLFIFGIPGELAGYKRNYSQRIRTKDGRRRFSWVILKAHTENAGRLTLRTRDPRDPPCINFRNFKDGEGQPDDDLLALEEAVWQVRAFMQPLRTDGITTREVVPGPDKEGESLRH